VARSEVTQTPFGPGGERDDPVSGGIAAPSGRFDLRPGEPAETPVHAAGSEVELVDAGVPPGDEHRVDATGDVVGPTGDHPGDGDLTGGHDLDAAVREIPGDAILDLPGPQLVERDPLARISLADVVGQHADPLRVAAQ
jgi:hypothetical protein